MNSPLTPTQGLVSDHLLRCRVGISLQSDLRGVNPAAHSRAFSCQGP